MPPPEKPLFAVPAEVCRFPDFRATLSDRSSSSLRDLRFSRSTLPRLAEPQTLRPCPGEHAAFKRRVNCRNREAFEFSGSRDGQARRGCDCPSKGEGP